MPTRVLVLTCSMLVPALGSVRAAAARQGAVTPQARPAEADSIERAAAAAFRPMLPTGETIECEPRTLDLHRSVDPCQDGCLGTSPCHAVRAGKTRTDSDSPCSVRAVAACGLSGTNTVVRLGQPHVTGDSATVTADFLRLTRRGRPRRYSVRMRFVRSDAGWRYIGENEVRQS